MKIAQIIAPKGFKYSDAPQKSPEWLAIRAPRVGASELGALMGKGKKDQYLAPRKKLLRELAFQKVLGVPFSKFVSGAMQEGIDNEDFVANEYSSQMGVALEKVGCFYNKHFVASPDRKIAGKNAGVEIKWLYDNEWSEVVENQKPKDEHYLQVQGQMWATGWDYVDFVAGNGNTVRFVVLRVKRDEATIKEIAKEVKIVDEVEPMKIDNVFEFNGGVPESVKDEGENIWT
jgi:predicted phage-related endonuclease